MFKLRRYKIQDLYIKKSGKDVRLKKIPSGNGFAYFICPIGRDGKYSAVGMLEHSGPHIVVDGAEIIIGRDDARIRLQLKKKYLKKFYVFGTLPTDIANVDNVENVLDGKVKSSKFLYIPEKIENRWSEERKEEYHSRVAKHFNKKIEERNGFSPDSILVRNVDPAYFEKENE